ncbi:hypothetical protein D5F01_LYC08972 [Larimichthys crocea]|uniref:Uncharacterized protein n=1 Tax=Larimichthys crocea TaxID=215358 RepID=A0A6G0IK79_LARCR|nr:hypothetical protein D5F01_LYC08972 [Larimichthys crocea]
MEHREREGNRAECNRKDEQRRETGSRALPPCRVFSPEEGRPQPAAGFIGALRTEVEGVGAEGGRGGGSLQLSQTFNCSGGGGRGCWGGSSPCCRELGGWESGQVLIPSPGAQGPSKLSPLPPDAAHLRLPALPPCPPPSPPSSTSTPLQPSFPSSLAPVCPADIIQLTTSVYTHPLINRLDSEHIDAGIGLIDHIQPPWLGFQR